MPTKHTTKSTSNGRYCFGDGSGIPSNVVDVKVDSSLSSLDQQIVFEAVPPLEYIYEQFMQQGHWRKVHFSLSAALLTI